MSIGTAMQIIAMKSSDALSKKISTLSAEVDNLPNTLFSDTGEKKINVNLVDGYAYISSGQILYSGTARANGNKMATVPLESFGELLRIPFDSSVSTSAVLGFGASNTLPTTSYNYWSKSNIMNGSQTTAKIMVDRETTIPQGYFVIKKSAVKELYPNCTCIYYNLPKDVNAEFVAIGGVGKKPIPWLKASNDNLSDTKVGRFFVVGADDTCDYKTISEAVEAAHDHDTIFIKDGEYEESVTLTKYIHLVGQSRKGTVLFNTNGDYASHPLLATSGSIKNMTVWAKKDDTKDYSGLTDYAYAFHLDKSFHDDISLRKFEADNCDFISDFNDAVGAGTLTGTEYDIHDCLLWCTDKHIKAEPYAFKCHIGKNQGQSYIRLVNNIFKTPNTSNANIRDILFHAGGLTEQGNVSVLACNNVLQRYYNACPNVVTLDDHSGGNTVQAMNVIQVYN